jgi:hypothetical protein
MEQPFSDRLDHWLKTDSKHTLESLSKVFAEKSFAIVILILMFLPALPIPTAGLTHVFELIVMLLAVELMLGRRTIWLPRRWRARPLGRMMRTKALPLMVRRIRWFEHYFRPRLSNWLDHPFFLRFAGGLFFFLALAAFVAFPPGAGLDTLPSLAAVVMALSLILGDILLFGLGGLIAIVGVGLVIAAGGLTLQLIQKLIHFI